MPIHNQRHGQNGRTPGVITADRHQSHKNGAANGHANGHSHLDWLHPHEVAARISPERWEKRGSSGATARCPCHTDNKPSLDIDLKDDKIVVICRAHCPQDVVFAALKQRGVSLFKPTEHRPQIDTGGNLAALNARGFKLTPYDYVDSNGVVVAQKVRAELFDKSGKRLAKTFRQRRPNPNGEGWIENLHGIEKLPPYRLHELLAAPDQDVHLAEGEKDADTLARRGFLVTSIDGLDRTDLEPFRGRNVILHEDNDAAGREKVAKKMAALQGIAASLLIVRYPDAGHKGDVTDWFKQGHTDEELLARIEESRTEPAAQKVDIQSPALEFDDQISVETGVDALVKGVLHPGDIGCIYGQSGVGKTFVAMDLAYHIARDQSWHGRRVRQAPVLYVALEGVRGLRHRMAAHAQHLGSAGRMLARLAIHTPLDRSEVGNGGEATIIEQAKALGEAASKPVGLIIIDTLARAIAGDDENSAQDMAAFVGRVSNIARESGAAVLILHHPGKDDARGMRGSTALFAACDVVIKITNSGIIREVVTEKVKDGEIGPLFSCQLKQVPLGIDDDGDEITSCIVQVADAGIKAPTRPPPDGQAGRALAELEELINGGCGKVAHGHRRAFDGALLVRKSAWRAACREKQLSTDGDAENEKKAFQRAFRTLLEGNLIGDHGDDVWPTKGTLRGHGQKRDRGHEGTFEGHHAESDNDQ